MNPSVILEGHWLFLGETLQRALAGGESSPDDDVIDALVPPGILLAPGELLEFFLRYNIGVRENAWEFERTVYRQNGDEIELDPLTGGGVGAVSWGSTGFEEMKVAFCFLLLRYLQNSQASACELPVLPADIHVDSFAAILDKFNGLADHGVGLNPTTVMMWRDKIVAWLGQCKDACDLGELRRIAGLPVPSPDAMSSFAQELGASFVEELLLVKFLEGSGFLLTRVVERPFIGYFKLRKDVEVDAELASRIGHNAAKGLDQWLAHALADGPQSGETVTTAPGVTAALDSAEAWLNERKCGPGNAVIFLPRQAKVLMEIHGAKQFVERWKEPAAMKGFLGRYGRYGVWGVGADPAGGSVCDVVAVDLQDYDGACWSGRPAAVSLVPEEQWVEAVVLREASGSAHGDVERRRLELKGHMQLKVDTGYEFANIHPENRRWFRVVLGQGTHVVNSAE
jgi:hypothetical protein